MTSRTIAIANQKGGVGKTTTTLGLAAAVAEAGGRVLIVDMDPQGNASDTLLPDYNTDVTGDTFYTTNDILDADMNPADLSDVIIKEPWPGVDLIPSEQALANRDVDGATGIEMRLRQVLRRGLPTLGRTYDLVLLDCPPSVGRLTVNAFLAAQEILLISEPDRYGHNALNQIEETLRIIRSAYDHDIIVAGLVVNMWERTREAQKRTALLQERLGDKVLMVLPKRTVLAGAAGSNQSIFATAGPEAREVAGRFTELAETLGLVSGGAVVRNVEQVAAGA